MSAVYADRLDKERRSNSFIVNGLVPKLDVVDKEMVSQLCNDEFNLFLSIVFCKRLGEVKPGIIQPILVALKYTTEAKEIISRARSLRRSPNEYVKANVYINPKLTKPEAHAAYLDRCRRKAQAINMPFAHHTNVSNSATHDANTTPAEAAARCVEAIRSQHSDHLIDTSNVMMDTVSVHRNDRVIINSQYHRQSEVTTVPPTATLDASGRPSRCN